MSHFVTDVLLVILGLVASVIIVLSIVGIGNFFNIYIGSSCYQINHIVYFEKKMPHTKYLLTLCLF